MMYAPLNTVGWPDWYLRNYIYKQIVPRCGRISASGLIDAINAASCGLRSVKSVVTITTSNLDNAQTTGHVYLTLRGTKGSTKELLTFAAGLKKMAVTRATVEHQDVGTLLDVTVRLVGNDGLHFSELDVSYEGLHTYTWTAYTWLDGDATLSQYTPNSLTPRVSASITLAVRSASKLIEGASEVARVRTMTGAGQWDATTGKIRLTMFGRFGHAGPITLSSDLKDLNDMDTARHPPPQLALSTLRMQLQHGTCPFSVLGFWGKMTMSSAGIIPQL